MYVHVHMYTCFFLFVKVSTCGENCAPSYIAPMIHVCSFIQEPYHFVPFPSPCGGK